MGSLTDVQKSLIVGTLLGDGYMSCKTNAYLQICHSIKQKLYVDFKYSILESLVNSKPKSYQGNERRVGYRFCTRSLPRLTRFYKLFYQQNGKGKKSIPNELDFDKFSLAVWYMDDGARNRKSVYFNTQQFSIKDQKKLLRFLFQQFGLKGSLNKDKSYYRIRLFQESAQKLKHMIVGYMPQFMCYKLPF